MQNRQRHSWSLPLSAGQLSTPWAQPCLMSFPLGQAFPQKQLCLFTPVEVFSFGGQVAKG